MEISWKPNFPVNDFSRNSGKKSRHHPNNTPLKVVTNLKTCQKCTVKGSITDGPVLFGQWPIKVKPGWLLSPLNDNPHNLVDTIK